ncbi:MAG: family 16 glycosylhydrolase [Clostridia bacterium]|nr:family 16 glycosylhydrolase [Clostridia bacterium]MBO5912043.1 family 16 glycosylhydrolase [Clostridia bacterium]
MNVLKITLRIVCLVLIFVLALCVFAGCGGSKSDSDTGKAEDNIFSTDDVKFVDGNGESVYRIIRPDGGDSSAAGIVFKQMKSTLGIVVKNVTDSTDGTDQYEILVGDTNRPESAKAKEYLIDNVGGRVNDYIICTIGKKIVIQGMSLEALKLASEYFHSNFVKPSVIKGGINYTCATKGDFIDVKINGVPINKFVFVKQRYNMSYVTQVQIEEAMTLITQKTGFALKLVEDNVDAAQNEIVIGDAKRDGVEKITDHDKYSVKVSGDKVYLNGGSPSSKGIAVSEFAKMLESGTVTDANSVAGSYTKTVASYDDSKLYKTVWSDDFDAPSDTHPTGVDLNKWVFMNDGSTGHNGRKSSRSQNPEHLFVKDGMLNFYATFDEERYYGFKIVTKNKMQFQYGVLEMSAILPDSGSTGSFWIALWAATIHENNPTAFNPEINVVEMFGNSASFASNMHGWMNKFQKDYYDSYWAPQGVKDHWSLDGKYSNDKKYYCPEGKFNDGLHTFSYIWTKDLCSFACDGNVFFSLDPNEKQQWNETFAQPLYIILSQATSFITREKCLDDNAPEWTTSNNFQIDYVHVYQKNDGIHQFSYLD